MDLLESSNKWFRQEALVLIGDRRDQSVLPRLREQVRHHTGQLALESLWALNLSGGLNEATALQYLDHPDPFVRLWTVRLLGDARDVSEPIAQKLTALAAGEPNVEVRAQLACTAKRSPPRKDCRSSRALLGRGEDMAEKRLPLLVLVGVGIQMRAGLGGGHGLV